MSHGYKSENEVGGGGGGAAGSSSPKGWGRRCFGLTLAGRLCLFKTTIRNIDKFCSSVSVSVLV